jgi:hypothetical protein
VAVNREGMRDRNPIAIAVDLVVWKKPSDIHVPVGDFELANGEPDCRVDPKLLLLEAVSKSW